MRALITTTGLLLCAVGTAAAQAHHVVVTPANTQWAPAPPSLPPGARVALLEGNPAQPGPSTMRVWLPDGFTIAPHTHSSEERLTVISGTFMVGMGETFDASKLMELPAGSYSSLGPNVAHFARAKGETVVQLNIMGPWTLTYLNPADDPRNAPRN